MAAFSSGGRKGRKRSKDQEMARDLKARGVERATGRCAICYKLIRNGTAYNHYSAHARGAQAD